jgi:hypothetical protein
LLLIIDKVGKIVIPAPDLIRATGQTPAGIQTLSPRKRGTTKSLLDSGFHRNDMK